MRIQSLKLNWRAISVELLIVVVGVLIALAADDWRQSRQDRALEVQYIQRLVGDLRLDSVSLENLLVESQARVEYAEAIVTTYGRGTWPGSGADLVRAIEYGDYLSYPSYSRSTLDDLMSTGNLRLLRDARVKEGLSQYHGTIEWTEQFSDVFRQAQGALGLYIAEILDLQERYALFSEGYSRSCGPTLACRSVIPWGPPSLEVTDDRGVQVLQRLLATPEALPLYATMARTQAAHYANLTGILASATELLALLQRALDDT